MSPDQHEFLVQLFFSLVPEQKGPEDLPELQATAHAILDQMVDPAHRDVVCDASNDGAYETSAVVELRRRLDATVQEIVRISTIIDDLGSYGKKIPPSRWAVFIDSFLGTHYEIWPTEFEKGHQERVEAAIREAFPDVFSSQSSAS